MTKMAGDESDGVIRDKDTAMVMFAMVCLQDSASRNLSTFCR